MKKHFTRLTAALLTIVMVLLMMPIWIFPISAEETTTITGYDNFGYLGSGYNLLGDQQLSNSSVTLKSAVFDDDFVNYVRAEERSGKESSYTYTYINDMNSYLHNQSSTLNCDISVGAKIKLFSIDVKTKVGITEKSTEESSVKHEYAMLKANQKIAYKYVNLESHLSDMWKNAVLSDAFLQEINELDSTNMAEFVEKFGTHIIVGYNSGGGAITSYRNETFSYTKNLFTEANTEVNVKAGYSDLVNAEATIRGTNSSDSTVQQQGEKAEAHGYSYGADGLIEWSNEGGDFGSVNDFFKLITKENSQILVDSDLKLIPIWDLILACTNREDSDEIKLKALQLKKYVNTKLNEQCSEFYEKYLGETYISDDADEDADEWLSEENLVIITSADDFNKIRNDLNGAYVLANDIDLSNYENWEPIGTHEAPFMGKLYGNYNTIKGLNITNPHGDYVGLFGYNIGKIKNLKLSGTIKASASPTTYIGGVAAYNAGTVQNCYDKVEYDVSYESVSDLNIPVREFDLTVASPQTITIGKHELGIRLTGEEGVTYSDFNIVVEENTVESPVYIILNNASIVGNSLNGTIYNPTYRPVYIISIGTSNTIQGGINSPSINAPQSDLYVQGTAELNVLGGNGERGGDGATGTPGYIAEEGKQGKDGANAIQALSVCANISSLSIIGGTGGAGGTGGYGLSNKAEPGFGGDGGAGGNGGNAISAEVVKLVGDDIQLIGGNGGNGGVGAYGELGPNCRDGYGGNGGNGGNGNCAIALEAEVTIVGNCLVVNGLGGNGGSGGAGHKDDSIFESSYHVYAPAGASGSSTSPRVDMYIDDKRYVLHDETKTWDDAKVSAESNGGHLATITSESEQSIIDELISYGALDDYYIGAYRVEPETDGNAWAWVTGEEFSFTNWNSGEPNNVGLSEDYVGIWKPYPGWNDYPNIAHGYIEEYDLTQEEAENPNILVGIITGYNNGTVLKINDSSWNNVTLTIDAINKTTDINLGSEGNEYIIKTPVYYSGEIINFITDEENGLLSDLVVSYEGKEITGYDYFFNTYCREGVFERNGNIKISREGVERYIPVKIIKPIPIEIDIVETGKTEFVLDGTFDISGLKLRVTYDNGDVEYVTDECLAVSYSVPPLKNLEGTETVTVYYDHDLNSATTPLSDTYDINVVVDGIIDLKIIEYPKRIYRQGDVLDVDGIRMKAIKRSGAEYELSSDDLLKVEYSVQPSLCYVGTSTVTVRFRDAFTSYSITVNEKVGFDHVWNKGTITKTPTHIETGIMTYTCTIENCGATKTEEIAKLTGHTFGDWYKLNDTQHQRMCECGETIELNHTWDHGAVQTPATHLSEGEILHSCTMCNATEIRIIEKTEAHTFGDWIKYDEVQHSDTCECGEVKYENHTWNKGIVTLEPTYIASGLIEYSCTECDATSTEDIPALEIPEDAPYIVVDSKNAVIGNTVTVKISLKNNPGITSLKLNVEYENALLKLCGVDYNSAMGGTRVEYDDDKLNSINGNVVLYWVDGFSNYEGDDVFATLTFEVLENTIADVTTSIVVTYDEDDIHDKSECNVEFFCVGGAIRFIDYIPGDINGDGVVNTKDTTRLMRYLANWDVEVNEAALDVNGDGVVNTKDTTRLMRYLANWDVEIY